jgi:hypothetical protein
LKITLRETNLVYTGLFLFFCVTSLFCFFSEGTYESGDSIEHFLIAKYSFKHHQLFLHHWGKPFFTLFSSAFAQFGFKGITIFNTLCATLTGLIVYHICKQLKIEQAWIAPLFALFTPIYYVVIISGLTEIFFGLVLTLSIFLFLKHRFTLGAILISFLPFVRSEGYLLLPLFAMVLAYHKKWTSIFLLGSGFIIYSVAGYFYYHDLLWVIHENPYKGAEDIYGSGSLFWFVSKNEFLLGTPLVILFLLGLISYALKKNASSFEEKILIIGGFAVYFLAHSVFWWRGIFGSLGLIRVIAGVAPLSAIVALRGFNFLLHSIKNTLVQKILTGLIILLVIWMPFKQHQFPRPIDHEATLIKETTTWLKTNNLDNRKLFSLYPYIPLLLNKDPFDGREHSGLWSSSLANIQKGDIIIWESHFCPQEGRVPLEKFTADPQVELLKQYHTEDKNLPFDIYIFQRL